MGLVNEKFTDMFRAWKDGVLSFHFHDKLYH